MATRGERSHDLARQRWQNRKSPFQLGQYHARIGRRRDENPYEGRGMPMSLEDWFAGWDKVRGHAQAQ